MFIKRYDKQNSHPSEDCEGVDTQHNSLERSDLLIATTAGSIALLLTVLGPTVMPADQGGLTNQYSASDQLSEAQSGFLPTNIPIPNPIRQHQFSAIAYNTNYDVNPEVKINEIEDLIKQADAVGVEEFTEDDKNEIAKSQLFLCNKCEFSGFIPDNNHSESAFFWRNKRFRMDSLNYYQLHEKNKTYIKNSDGTLSKIKQKTLIVVSGTDLMDDKPIAFLVFHDIYDHVANGVLRRNEKERIDIYFKERQKLIERITELNIKGIPMVVLGDLNVPPGLTDKDTIEHILKDMGLQSMYDSNVLNLTPDEKYTHDETKMDIDYILALGSDFKIIQRKNMGDWASDHDPVWAKIIKIRQTQNPKNKIYNYQLNKLNGFKVTTY